MGIGFGDADVDLALAGRADQNRTPSTAHQIAMESADITATKGSNTGGWGPPFNDESRVGKLYWPYQANAGLSTDSLSCLRLLTRERAQTL